MLGGLHHFASHDSMNRVDRRIVAYRTLVVRVNPFPLKPGQGVYLFKLVQPLFVGDVNHLDPADAGIGRDWSGFSMAIWRGARGGPHANLGGRALAAAFIDVLTVNTSVIDGTQLFSQMRRPVILNADQTPRYSDVRKAGHEGGDFLFVRRR